MAKRKRLTPARPDFLGAEATSPAPGVPGRPPIAQVAGAAATSAAFDAVTAELASAREEGRLILRLPRAAIRADHLVRDRVALDRDALEELKESLKRRGQQTPVEVVELGETGSDTGQYGLISGWRRLLALEELQTETGEDRFGEVLALVRVPEDLSQAYVAMVEENEIRADLSGYERARIVRRSLESGVFEDETTALRTLFAAASYPKRSKIKSFLPVVDALDMALRFPARIPERTGLALARAIEADPGFGPALAEELREKAPADGDAEQALIADALKRAEKDTLKGEKPGKPEPRLIRPGVTVERRKGRLVIAGPRVNDMLMMQIEEWIRLNV